MSRPEEHWPEGPELTNGVAGGSADDPRLEAALQEYLAELEAGRRPGREEFLARHAAIAPALGPYLEGLEVMHAAAPPSGAAAGGGAAACLRGTPLGDFLLLREVGR